jgi:hypothetical protein
VALGYDGGGRRLDGRFAAYDFAVTVATLHALTDPIEGGSCNDYDYVCGDPVNDFDLAGTCKTHHKSWSSFNPMSAGFRSIACRVSNGIRHVANVGRGIGRGAVRYGGGCLRDPDGCTTNIKIAFSPIMAAGATFGFGAATVAVCATLIGCAVGGWFLGGATVGSAYVTYRLAKRVWFGGHRQYYHRGE